MIRRIRTHAGVWSLVALIGLAMVFTLAATPPTLNGVSDTALRRMIAQAPYGTRDLTFSQSTPNTDQIGRVGATPQGFRDALEYQLPDVVDGAVGARWAAMNTELATLAGAGVNTEPDGVLPGVGIWHQPDLEPALRIVEGRAPADLAATREIEVMTAVGVAQALRLRLGQPYEVAATNGMRVTVRLVGLYAAIDPGAPDWEPYPMLLRTGWQQVGLEAVRSTGTLVASPAGMRSLREDAAGWGMRTTARFRLDERRLHAGQAAGLRDAVRQLRTDQDLFAQAVGVHTRLDELVSRFERQQNAVRALFAVVGAGILGTGLGLLGIAARLAVDRRRTELRLLRARGASLVRLVGTVGVEACVAVIPAALAGWLAHHLVPGRTEPTTLGTVWPVVGVALLATAAVPLAALVVQRDRTADRRRHDLVLLRPGPRRLTAELTVLLLAVLGVLLLHRRGLSTAGVDPYLSAVPVLVGVAAGLLGLRAYPWPVRLLGRLSNGRRGATAFLGLARAGRRTASFALPVIVLVLAVSLGGFAAAVWTGISAARGVAAALEVGADFRLAATAFAPDAQQSVAAVPRVRAVLAARQLDSHGLVLDGNAQPDTVAVMAVDPTEYQRLLDVHRLDVRLPAVLLGGPLEAQPVPVAVSPTVAARFGGTATLTVGDAVVPLRLAGTLDRLPGLDGGRDEFVLVPTGAVGADAPVTALLVTGQRADPATLARAAGTVDAAASQVTSLVERRRALQRSEFNEGITLAFGVGLASAAAAGLLAVGLALVIEARARGQVLSLVRTMGLSIGQARAVLLVELAPLMATALLVGGAAGVALPLLLAPALDLSTFTGGVPLRLRLDPVIAGVLVGLFAALLAGAVMTEAEANRRLGLAQVLRVGAD